MSSPSPIVAPSLSVAAAVEAGVAAGVASGEAELNLHSISIWTERSVHELLSNHWWTIWTVSYCQYRQRDRW